MGRVFFVLLLLILNACASLPTDVLATKDQIMSATKEWQAAYDSRDPKRIVSMYDEEAVIWGTTHSNLWRNCLYLGILHVHGHQRLSNGAQAGKIHFGISQQGREVACCSSPFLGVAVIKRQCTICCGVYG